MIHKRIKQLREALNLSQSEFAQKLGKTTAAVIAWEIAQNKPSKHALLLICETFHVSRHWLETGAGEIFDYTPAFDDTTAEKRFELATRLKRLRRELNLTQAEFADRIGKKIGTITAWEVSAANIPDSALLLICQTFNVSRHWLETGEGDIFDRPRALFVDDPEEMSVDNVIRWILSRFDRLPDDIKKDIRELVLSIASRIMSGE